MSNGQLKKVEPDALIAQLSTAYRSCRQLLAIVATVNLAVEKAGAIRLGVDVGWLYEMANQLDTDACDAMIAAAESLGFEENDLVRCVTLSELETRASLLDLLMTPRGPTRRITDLAD